MTAQAIEQGLKAMLADRSKVRAMSEQALRLMGEDKWNEVIDRIMGGDYGRPKGLQA